MVTYEQQAFVVIEVVQRKRQVLIEAWYLPPRTNEVPGHPTPPMRLRYRSMDITNAKKAAAWIEFGYVLVRTDQHNVVIQAVDGKGKPFGASVNIQIAGDPELLGLIQTGTS
jgi:hypothetical protein